MSYEPQWINKYTLRGKLCLFTELQWTDNITTVWIQNPLTNKADGRHIVERLWT